MTHTNDIITYSQSPKAFGGIYVKDHIHTSVRKSIIDHTHRDDYYVISIVTDGELLMDCEMEKFIAQRNNILIVKPYQIHSVRHISNDFKGYFLGIQDFRIPNDINDLLYTLPESQQLLSISEEEMEMLATTFELMKKYIATDSQHKTQIINGLFSTALYSICSQTTHNQSVKDLGTQSQPAVITSNFKRLITHQTHLNLPSYFANELSITTAHLNDCVKKTTGQTVSYWLKKSILDEAKRLLYYTNKPVKEIAFNLGFEDHTYFSRMFKKLTYQTPLQFRDTVRA
ncbi:AraC family transcriptional regulator [Myroides marinus]|uniref:AraC-like ligand binding domain-containing protein n=1 Tax=Myroides marinus TaxID=703342 RepID=A0A1H6WXF2_9FLAO|nr:helix-turn-helix domain-containing protein [Myroides marinus]MDM1502917.1 AraC family transcriptional regulator [Myroides marinus]SEJ21569.1 AraC-like ligand binding domain-containing protein [Myroides marinus]